MTYIQTELGTVIKTQNPQYWLNDPRNKQISAREGKLVLKIRAVGELIPMLPIGTTVYTVLRHVNASGTVRHIDLYVMIDNRPQYITGLAADLLDATRTKDNAIRITGCGADMGFELVYRLSRALFPNGTDQNPDGGYALKQEWI